MLTTTLSLCFRYDATTTLLMLTDVDLHTRARTLRIPTKHTPHNRENTHMCPCVLCVVRVPVNKSNAHAFLEAPWWRRLVDIYRRSRRRRRRRSASRHRTEMKMRRRRALLAAPLVIIVYSRFICILCMKRRCVLRSDTLLLLSLM